MQYATVSDLIALWRPLGASEVERAEKLLDIVSSELRSKASALGKNLDEMVAGNSDLANIAKSVTCDVVARTLMTSTNSEPVSQFSQSVGGYSVSGTYLVPGGGVFIKRSELARLGLRKARIGGIDFAD